jgi:hypothetical protein
VFRPAGANGGDAPAADGDPAVADADPTAPDASPDRDMDGVVDGMDGCPGAYNPDQRDEDGDTVQDACDNCVGVPNVDQTDVGENQPDGIGNACDPRAGGDDVVLVTYFVEGGADPADLMRAGEWNVDGERAVNGDAGYSWLAPATAFAPTIEIEVGFNRATELVAQNDVGVQYSIPVSPMQIDGYRCMLRQFQVGGSRLYLFQGGTVDDLADRVGDLPAFVRVRARDLGATSRCGEAAEDLVVSGAGPDYGDRVGIIVDGLSAEVTYVVIYRLL